MFFFKIGTEAGYNEVDALDRSYQSFEEEFSAILKAQFCFSGDDKELAVVSQIRLKDLGRGDREEFLSALDNFLDSYWGECPIDSESYIHILMRSKGVDGGHEFYVIKTKGDRRDEQSFRAFVDDFFNFKTKGIDEIMLSKNLDVVFEDRS